MVAKNLNVYQRLSEVRKSVEYLKKDKQGQQFMYVGSADVLAALREKINEAGLILVPEIVNHKVSVYERTNSKGNPTNDYFTELDMTMTWVNIDVPEETVKVSWYAQGVDLAGEKGVGKALTYGEKYFMLKFFNIPTDKDDPDAFQDKTEAKKPTAKISDEQKNEIATLSKDYAEMRGLHGEAAAKQALDWTINQVKIKNLDNADFAQGEAAINLLNGLILKHRKQTEQSEQAKQEGLELTYPQAK